MISLTSLSRYDFSASVSFSSVTQHFPLQEERIIPELWAQTSRGGGNTMVGTQTWCVWQVETPAGATGRALGAWAGASVSQGGSPSPDSPSPPPAPLKVNIGKVGHTCIRWGRTMMSTGKAGRKLNAHAAAAVCSARRADLKNAWWVRTMSSLWRKSHLKTQVSETSMHAG